jgi:F-type H+-transporting ATPase subunit b
MVTIDKTLLFQMINIIILMFLLNGVLFRPIKNILKERAKKMMGMQGDVAKFEKNAQLRQEEVNAKMKKASGKAKAALDAARADAQAVGEEKLASIKAEVDTFKEKQLAEINTQIGEASAGLKANLDGFATAMASKILGRAL